MRVLYKFNATAVLFTQDQAVSASFSSSRSRRRSLQIEDAALHRAIASALGSGISTCGRSGTARTGTPSCMTRRAGTPTTVAFGGTSFTTTEPPPTFELSPIRNRSQNGGIHADRHVFSERGVTFTVREAGAAERNALIDRAVVADLRRLTDDDAHAVIDEDAFAQRRARIDLDARKKPADLREPARQQRNPGAVERMDKLVRGNRVKARIRQDDVEPPARRRVAFEGRVNRQARSRKGRP